MAIKYVDPINGNDANTGLTMATAWKDINVKFTTLTAGDTLRVKSSPGPTSLGQTATWTNKNKTVTLTTAVTQNLDMCESGWTASANITLSYNTTVRKEGAASMLISPGSAFTTGLVCYKTLASTLDLSSYQQLSFWINGNATNVPSGRWEIRLCSDSAGATAVNTFSVPVCATSAQWHAITIDSGAALGTTINSVAIYALTDPGTVAFYIDDIIVGKAPSAADSLALNSLISKNTAGEFWFSIQSINGTTIIVDNRGYYSPTGVASESVTIYKREAFKPVSALPTSSTAIVYNIPKGVATSADSDVFTTLSGGWSNDTTQDGESWFDGIIGSGYAFDVNSNANIILEKIGTVRYYVGFNISTNTMRSFFNNCSSVGADFTGFQSSSGGKYFYNDCTVINSYGYGLNIGASHSYFKNLSSIGCDAQNGIGGIYTTNPVIVDGGLLANNSGYGISSTVGGTLKNVTFKDNSAASVRHQNLPGLPFFFTNCLMSDSPEVSGPSTSFGYANPRSYSNKHDQTANNHVIFMNAGKIQTDTAIRHTASGVSWKIMPTGVGWSSDFPLWLKVGVIYGKASTLTTASLWMYRDNAGLTMKLACRGGQIAGIASDVTSSITTTSTWEQISISFTPTEDGPIEIEAWAYGGTTYNGWVDDFSVA